MVQLANSPLMRTGAKIDDLTTAVMRLGVDRTANLATSIAMKQMFQATSDAVDTHMRENWAISTEVAGRCHVLCRRFTGLQPDQASLAGLTHRIGVLPILTFAEVNDELLSDHATLDNVINAIHPQIGAKILDAWDFPDHLKSVPLEYENGDRELDEADYSDLVYVASQQINGTSEGMECASFQRLGISANADDEELQADAKAAAQLFN
jgi:HD-like signal output (HDOD) protein